jgi:hypothetical protein
LLPLLHKRGFVGRWAYKQLRLRPRFIADSNAHGLPLVTMRLDPSIAKKLLIIVVIMGAVNWLWVFTHMEAYCFFYPSIDTKYASQYTEEAFDRIRTGMTTNEVSMLLGRPLGVASNQDGSQSWWFTGDGKCLFGDFAWLGREVQIREGKVSGAFKSIFYD